MKSAIGKRMTRIDHPSVSNQMYAMYAMGKDKQSLKAVVGEEALDEDEKLYIKFEEQFEKEFLCQEPYEERDIFQSLEKAWELLRTFPRDLLSKITPEMRDLYFDRGDAKKNMYLQTEPKEWAEARKKKAEEAERKRKALLERKKD